MLRDKILERLLKLNITNGKVFAVVNIWPRKTYLGKSWIFSYEIFSKGQDIKHRVGYSQTNKIFGKRQDILETNEIFGKGHNIIKLTKIFDKLQDIGGTNKIFGKGRNRQRSYRQANQSARSQTLPG